MNPQPPGSGARPSSHWIWILLALFAVLYLPWLRSEPPVSGLETTRILVAREMVRSHDWVIPTQDGIPYFAKPPFGYWLIALGTAPFGGVDVVPARLVSALCVLALALAVAFFVRREIDSRVGLLAGLCVLCNGLFLRKGLSAELETPFALFTSLAILGAFRAVWSERHGWIWSMASGLALGAACLIKGPLAALLFILSMAWTAIGTRRRRRLVIARSSVALTIGVLVGGAWLVALYLHGADPTAFDRLFDEAFKRVHAPGRTNREPWWFYGPALIVSFLPASLLLPAMLMVRPPDESVGDRHRSLFALLVGWSMVSLLAITVSSGKETRYLIALFPAWCILAAWAWCRSRRPSWLQAWRRTLVLLGIALAWLLPVALAVTGRVVWPGAWIGTSLSVGIAALALVSLEIGRRGARRPLLWSALLLGLLAVRVFWAEVPMAQKRAAYPIEVMGADIAQRLSPGEPLVQFGEYSSEIQLQVDHPIRRASTLADVSQAAGEEPRARFVLTRASHLHPGQETGWREVASWPYGQDRFQLLQVP